LTARYYSGVPGNATALQPDSTGWMGLLTPVFTGILTIPIDNMTNIQGQGFPDNTGTRPASPVIAPGNNQGALWTGLIDIPQTDPITFFTGSDDGSMLWIDGSGPDNTDGATVLVNNNFQQGLAYRNSGPVSLTPGLHTISVAFYNGGGGATMNLKWDLSGGT